MDDKVKRLIVSNKNDKKRGTQKTKEVAKMQLSLIKEKMFK